VKQEGCGLAFKLDQWVAEHVVMFVRV